MPSRGFIFQAQALHSVAAEPDQNRHAYCTIPEVRAWNLQRWHGRGPAHLIPAKCAGPLPVSAVSVCCQARILWMLWADATWRRAPKQQGDLRRCRGAPNGSYITQIIGVR
jgi:hypothetical protein